MDNLPDPDMSDANDILAKDYKNVNALADESLKQKKMEIENKYAAQTAQSDIDYKNALSQSENLKSKYYPQDVESQINSRNALTNKTNQETDNPLLGTSGLGGEQAAVEYFRKKYGDNSQQFKMIMDSYKQKQDSVKALTQQRATGGSGRNSNITQLNALRSQLQTEHPDWKPESVDAATSSYLAGSDSLPNGDPLPQPSGTVNTLLDEIFKQRSTSSLITKGVQANSGEAELGVLNKRALEATKLAGTQYFGKSPSVIAASLGNDDASQEKLGKIIGGNALQYAVAQIRNRIDQGQPGITATKEIMGNSGQLIDAVGVPRLTSKARETAMKYIQGATDEALQARNEYGVGAQGATGKSKKSESAGKVRTYNLKTGSFE